MHQPAHTGPTRPQPEGALPGGAGGGEPPVSPGAGTLVPGICQERRNLHQPSVSSQAESRDWELGIIQKLGFGSLLCYFEQKAYPL